MSILPAPILRTADAQYGAVGRFQLLDHATDDQVHGWLKNGHLERIFRGSYRVSGSGTSRLQTAMAALLRARPGAALTGPFVLGLLDVDGFTTEDPFTVLTAPGRRLSEAGFEHLNDPYPDRLKAGHGALRVAMPTDALLETAATLGRTDERRCRVGLDSATWRGLTTPERVRERAEELGREHAGAALFLDLLADGLEASETDGERILGRLLQHFDPSPEAQVWVTPRRRADWLFRLLRLIFEFQGSVDHGFAARRAADVERDDELGAAGFLVVPVVHADLADEGAALAWIEATLVKRAHELGVPAPVRRG
jgi:very-short-patch-repair endonuclease